MELTACVARDGADDRDARIFTVYAVCAVHLAAIRNGKYVPRARRSDPRTDRASRGETYLSSLTVYECLAGQVGSENVCEMGAAEWCLQPVTKAAVCALNC
jgi:hypothetical protein